MTRVLLVLGLISVLGVVGIPLTGVYVDRKMSKDVILIAPHDKDMVEMNRVMWEKGQPVPPIYGNPVDKPIRVVRPDPAFTIVPEEDPKLTLLKSNADHHPLQLQSVLFVVKWSTVASALAAVVFFLAFMVRIAKRKDAVEAAPGA